MTSLVSPHGEKLNERLLSPEEAKEIKLKARDYLSWDMTERQLCDIEMILNGGFSPLNGFMGESDYDSVVNNLRLTRGILWPIPITLDVTETFARQASKGTYIALRDQEGVLIAVLNVSDIWTPDKTKEAQLVYETEDRSHPGVDYLFNKAHPVYIGGEISGIEMPAHYDFKHLRDSPRELRKKFKRLGWRKIVAFQTRNPMHRAHLELTFRAAQLAEANLLIHPVVGMTKPGDIDYYSRVRCYEHVIKHYPELTTILSLLPLAMRMGGPREALWHAIIRKNYGCTHLIVGRDHAGPGKNNQGKDFYGPYESQKMVKIYQHEIGIEMIPFQMMVYVKERAKYILENEVEEGQAVINISGTELRRRLQEGLDIPEWFSHPEVVKELKKTYPPKQNQGFTIFFTGLSGAGKSTIAKALMVKFMEIGGRPVTLLDGDLVRRNLSSELGFSREHRDINIIRIGFVATEITKNGGIAICAPIAPYLSTRQKVRESISIVGGFFEVYVSTPLEVCEARDRKGLYAKARAGIIKEFTGISDPYETPESPDLVIDTQDCLPDEAAQIIILRLEKEGYIR